MMTIPILLSCLLAGATQSGPPVGTVYVAGSGPPIGRPHRTFWQHPGPVEGLGKAIQAEGGASFSVALRADGSVATWGSGSNGELGLGKNISAGTATTVPGLPPCKAIAAGPNFCLAVSQTGEVYGWGYGHAGQLGPSTTLSRNSTPIKIAGLSNVAAVSAGQGFSLALRQDGTVWSWGSNSNGQLGSGNTTDRSTPAQVAGLANVVQLVTGGSRVFALRSDGILLAWGSNSFGWLGTGSAPGTSVSSPTPVQNGTLIKQVAAGTNHTLALRDDGLVMSWGQNDTWQLGDPAKPKTYQGTDTPAVIPGLAGVAKIGAAGNSSFAIDGDGDLFIFGRTDGFLEAFRVDAPTQVPGVEKVVTASGGEYHGLFISTTSTPIWSYAIPGSTVAPYGSPMLRVVVEGGTTSDIPVTFTSSGTAASLPANAVIPAGSDHVDVPISCPTRVNKSVYIILEATAGAVTAPSTFSVESQQVGISIAPNEVQAGDSTGGYVRLNYPAPGGGVDVTMSCDHPTDVMIPATVHILGGSDKAFFEVHTKPSLTLTYAIITADLGNRHGESNVVVRGNPLGGIEFDKASTLGGGTLNLTVRLAAPAPSGGTVVNLLKSSDIFTLPATVTLTEGQQEATVVVRTKTVKEETQAWVTAYVGGFYSKSRSFQILAPALTVAKLSKEIVKGGDSITLRIELEAVSAGDTVTLTTTDPAIPVPATIEIPAGKRVVTLPITTATVDVSKRVTVRATLRGVRLAATSIVSAPAPPLASLTLSASMIKGGKTVIGTVTLSAAAYLDGATVKLTSLNPELATVPESVYVKPGATTATFKVTTVPTTTTVSTTILARLNGIAQKAKLTIQP